jgi:hypothetical protein
LEHFPIEEDGKSTKSREKDEKFFIWIFRKLPLVLGLIGKFIYSSMIVVNSLQPSWPVEFVIYTATIPSAFTGAGK